MYNPFYINGFLVNTYFSTFNVCMYTTIYLAVRTHVEDLIEHRWELFCFVNRLHFFFILEGGFDLKLGLPAISLALGKGTPRIAQDNFLTGKKCVNSS